MTSIYETTDRLIGEHLDALLEIGWQVDDVVLSMLADRMVFPERSAQFVRLVWAVRSLCLQHRKDARGRCRICVKRGRLRRRRLARPCTVYSALSFFLTQPDDLVLRDIPKPVTMPPPLRAEQTVRLPTIP